MLTSRQALGPLALSGSTLAFPIAQRSDSWNTVQTSTFAGVRRTVAHSDWSTGLINWVALGGDWLAYVDQSHTQGNEGNDVLWRVWAVPLDGGARVLLSSNGQTSDPYVPVVRSGGGYFFWTQAEPDRSAREFIWRPGWDAPRTLIRHIEMTPGSETWSQGGIVYLGPNGKGLSGHTTGGDCWRLPVDGSPPVALTHTALAVGCAASDDTLVWTQHLPLKDPRADDVGEQPFTTWTLDLEEAHAEPTKVYNDIQSGLYPAAGTGFVVWAELARSLLVRSSTTGRVRSVRGALSMVAGGHHLAVDNYAHSRWTVVVYDVP